MIKCTQDKDYLFSLFQVYLLCCEGRFKLPAKSLRSDDEDDLKDADLIDWREWFKKSKQLDTAF